MIYNGVEFDTLQGSTSFVHEKDLEVISLPYSNDNKSINKGKRATQITTSIIAFSSSEKIAISSLLHSPGEAKLEIDDIYYQKVESGQRFSPEPIGRLGSDKWLIGATFIALDPIPYDLESGDPLYD